MQDMFFFHLKQKSSAGMDDWLGKSRSTGRIQNDEWMVECNRRKHERRCRHRKEIMSRNAVMVRQDYYDGEYAFGMDETSMEWDSTLGNTTTF